MERQAEIRKGADLGHVLAEARRAQGLTQAEMAHQVGLTRVYLNALESGRSTPLLDHYLRALRRIGAEVTVTYRVPARKDDGDGQT
jgi:transcriptional regulator with XRE-family HTH domain